MMFVSSPFFRTKNMQFPLISCKPSLLACKKVDGKLQRFAGGARKIKYARVGWWTSGAYNGCSTMNTNNLTERGGARPFVLAPILEKQRTKLWISGAKAEYMQNGRENPVDSNERFLPADRCCSLGKSFAQD